MMFRVGEYVRIKVGNGYFGPRYEGTVAKVIAISHSNLYDVEMYDGKIFSAVYEMFEPVDEALLYPEINNDTEKQKKCKHVNMYVNVLSKSLRFWVCPDCQKDLGDFKDGTKKP